MAAASVIGLALLAAAGYALFSDARATAAAIALAMLAGAGAIAWRRPRAAIWVSLVLLLLAGTKFRLREPTDSLDGVADAQILFELGLFAAVGVAGLAAWLSSRDRAKVGKVELLMAAYVAVALASVLWSAVPLLSLVRAMQLLILAVLAAAAVRVLQPSVSLWAPAAVGAVYTAACAALAATFPWASGTVERAGRVRFAWFSVHPIEVATLAAIVALGATAAILWPPHGLSRRRAAAALLYGPAAICATAVLIVTHSRGPLLAFVAGLAILAFLRISARCRPAVVAVAAALLAVFVTAGPDLTEWLFRAATQNRAASRVVLQGQSPDEVLGLSGRMELWTDTRPAVEAHGLFGYGYQASRPILLEAADWTPAYAHNAFLQSLLDVGVAGTLALIALVGIALSALFRPTLPPRVRGATAAFAVFLLVNAITTESFAGAPGLEALVLFICAMCAATAGPRTRPA